VLDRRNEVPRKPFVPVDELAAGHEVHKVSPTPGYAVEGAPDFGGLGRIARRITRTRVGLALGGGGSRALAQVGVVDVLARNGIPVDVLAGTSAGAIVAGLSARDWDAQQIREFLLHVWTRKLLDWRLPWVSILRGRRLKRVAVEAGSGLQMQEVDRPFIAVASDLVDGAEVWLRRGDGWTAVLASLSVPGVFPPVRIGDRYLVDGGAVNNVPVSAARAAGADIVLGVDVTPPLEPEFLPDPDDATDPGGWRLILKKLRSPPPLLRILFRTVAVQGMALQAQRASADYTLSPDVSGYDLFDFRNVSAIVERGRAATEAHIAEIRRVALPASKR